MNRRAAIWLGILAAGFALLPAGASAATIVVNDTIDEYEVGQPCSLREAVEVANTNDSSGNLGCVGDAAGPDTIVLTAGQTYTLDRHNPPEDSNIYGDLDISGGGGTTIQSNGTGLATIDGYGPAAPLANRDRVIDVLPAAGPVTLSRLRIQNGHERSTNALTAIGTGGGGIHNQATLSVVDSEITDNDATDNGVNGGPRILGGGILNESGSLTLTRSTVAGNTTNDGLDGEGWGGGIANLAGAFTATNSTISGNTAKEDPAGFFSDPIGGGIWQTSAVGTTMTLTNLTITDNDVTSSENEGEAGGIYIAGVGPSDKLSGTIIAGNTAPGIDDCYGTFYSGGSNLIGPVFGCTLLGPSNELTGVPDAMLGALSDYGGPTRTHYLNPGSPAINHGVPNGPATDQRGVSRPQGPACDIGAFELDSNPMPGFNCAGLIPVQPPSTSPTVSPAAAAGPTGKRAAALAKCKKKKGKARKKCRKRALQLAV